MWPLLLAPLVVGATWSVLASDGTVTAAAQREAAQAQIAAASQGRTLAHLDAELHAPVWFSRPDSLEGAYYRVAYWLGAGARVGAIDPTMLNAARQALGLADQVGARGAAANPFEWEAGRVTAAIRDGMRVAEQRGREDVAAALYRVSLGTSTALVSTPQARTRVLLFTLPVLAGAAAYWLRRR